VVDATTGVATRVAGTAVTGSPSAVPPDIPAGKLPICQVLINDDDTVITNSMITDERVPAGQSTNGQLQDMQVFTSNGPWNKPAGLKRVKVTVVGGGGGGGNSNNPSLFGG